MDFYFAEMEKIPVDDELHTVATVDNGLFGITMKIVDLENAPNNKGDMSQFLGSSEGGAVTTLVQGLLSTDLKANGYPVAVGGSLGTLFAKARPVNHLFIESTYRASGYYEYDSAENFASLNGNDFKVYKELGTNDFDGRKTLKHGQFFPFNDIEAGTFASVNRENLYSSTGPELPNDDPRKHEQLYLVKNNTDYYFGMELEATFTQTPSGLDAWGHDIIFEFTGDDDFWLYVDGELVIDLGGIHSAVPGSVNFRTGEVNVNGTHTTLRELFYNNFLSRDDHTPGEAEAYVDSIFEQNADGQWVFKDYTDHSMRIFYMERGAGASNLHMRFNLAAVRKGYAQLTKTVSGIDQEEAILAEFPYQIWYKIDGDDTEYRLQNFIAPEFEHDPEANPYDYVFYEGTSTPVKFMHNFTVPGTNPQLSYKDVFFLKPGETADISFPNGMTEYKLVECAVNTAVYDTVSVYDSASIGGRKIEGTQTEDSGRQDFGIGYAMTEKRSRVRYDNHIDSNALRNLSFTKKLYDETGVQELADDGSRFSFRLYLGTEFYVPASEDDELELPPANIYKYHVKDPYGNYCVWDKENEKFESTEKSEFADLTSEEKKAGSFDTSINGAITKIPAWYTVEIRQILAGTQFQLLERPWEIPDGYSYQKYVYNDVEQKEGDQYVPALTGVRDTVVAGTDPHVDICNLKGWGLRVNKTWTDAAYMQDRKPTYFAVFTKDDSNNLTLVPNTVRELKYTESPQSVYWYFQTLPVQEVTDFDRYEIREVTIQTTDPDVNDEGIVTNPGEVTVIGEGGSLTIKGKQKGENDFIDYTYTVGYEKGILESGSNVRTDNVINDRPGIILKKTQWDGETPLKGAEFMLSRRDGGGNETIIGTFFSGEDGVITTAYLGSNVDYILTETAAPHPYYGLDTPLTIRLNSERVITVTSSGLSEGSYILTQASEGGPATITVKNRPFTLTVKKVDSVTGDPLPGAEFALYGRKNIDGVITTDSKPKQGYDSLKTGKGGIVPDVNASLPAGLYAIKEVEAPDGYTEFKPGFEIDFAIDGKGAVTIDSDNDYASWLTYTVNSETGNVDYMMTVPNEAMTAEITLKKVAKGSTEPLPGSEFKLYIRNDAGKYVSDEGIDATKADKIHVLTEGSLTITGLPAGDYKLTEMKAPDGYVIQNKDIFFTVNASTTGPVITKTKGQEAFDSAQIGAYTEGTKKDTLVIPNTPGAELPITGGRGTALFTAVGAALSGTAGAILTLKRRKEVA
jgi:fibro-slime domain-containing protein/LPXTG-motif cell wall-anchored protein